MQTNEKALSTELDKQRKRVAAVHARLAGRADTCLAGIAATRPGMSLFVQHCILPRVTYSAEVCEPEILVGPHSENCCVGSTRLASRRQHEHALALLSFLFSHNQDVSDPTVRRS